jgi:hypothetical protein
MPSAWSKYLDTKAQTFDSTSVSSSLISLLSCSIGQKRGHLLRRLENIHHEWLVHSSSPFHSISFAFDLARSKNHNFFSWPDMRAEKQCLPRGGFVAPSSDVVTRRCRLYWKEKGSRPAYQLRVKSCSYYPQVCWLPEVKCHTRERKRWWSPPFTSRSWDASAESNWFSDSKSLILWVAARFSFCSSWTMCLRKINVHCHNKWKKTNNILEPGHFLAICGRFSFRRKNFRFRDSIR